eukprot:scaffold53306_cov19-Tisochrysis_lutea.AAC.1
MVFNTCVCVISHLPIVTRSSHNLSHGACTYCRSLYVVVAAPNGHAHAQTRTCPAPEASATCLSGGAGFLSFICSTPMDTKLRGAFMSRLLGRMLWGGGSLGSNLQRGARGGLCALNACQGAGQVCLLRRRGGQLRGREEGRGRGMDQVRERQSRLRKQKWTRCVCKTAEG